MTNTHTQLLSATKEMLFIRLDMYSAFGGSNHHIVDGSRRRGKRNAGRRMYVVQDSVRDHRQMNCSLVLVRGITEIHQVYDMVKSSNPNYSASSTAAFP